ncbi:uncharacterized protein PG986_008424 [Apiospora aurea]|uniref:Uncharacterized protein n=1 Tax=Apiospora aurea TaxID=335848 RepID=A0ABR1QG50_9PEZI
MVVDGFGSPHDDVTFDSLHLLCGLLLQNTHPVTAFLGNQWTQLQNPWLRHRSVPCSLAGKQGSRNRGPGARGSEAGELLILGGAYPTSGNHLQVINHLAILERVWGRTVNCLVAITADEVQVVGPRAPSRGTGREGRWLAFERAPVSDHDAAKSRRCIVTSDQGAQRYPDAADARWGRRRRGGRAVWEVEDLRREYQQTGHGQRSGELLVTQAPSPWLAGSVVC